MQLVVLRSVDACGYKYTETKKRLICFKQTIGVSFLYFFMVILFDFYSVIGICFLLFVCFHFPLHFLIVSLLLCMHLLISITD